MSKNLSKGYDKGQGVKKRGPDGKVNPKWKAIHWGTKVPRGSYDCGKDHPNTLSDII